MLRAPQQESPGWQLARGPCSPHLQKSQGSSEDPAQPKINTEVRVGLPRGTAVSAGQDAFFSVRVCWGNGSIPRKSLGSTWVRVMRSLLPWPLGASARAPVLGGSSCFPSPPQQVTWRLTRTHMLLTFKWPVWTFQKPPGHSLGNSGSGRWKAHESSFCSTHVSCYTRERDPER